MNDKFKTWEEAVLWLRNHSDSRDLVLACYYDDPVSESSHRFYESAEWNATRELLSDRPKGSMLDIGAGRGIASFAFAKDGWQVTALEPDQSDIVGSGAIKNLADHENLAITVVNEWGETLPFDNSSFDLVYVRAVLHHARDLQRFCSEIVRVLKPNGMLLAVREHVISKTDDLETFLYVHPLHKLYGGENAFLLKEYKDAMISAGFDIVRTIKPFENPINFSPQSRRSLCGEILNRVKIVPAGLKDILLSRNFVLSLLLRLAGLLDNRPGRHYSFVCIKPGL